MEDVKRWSKENDVATARVQGCFRSPYYGVQIMGWVTVQQPLLEEVYQDRKSVV